VDLTSPRDFVGKAALLAAHPSRQLAGLVLQDPGGILRSHQQLKSAHGDGEVTSGTYSPTLAKSIALARMPSAVAPGDTVHVDIRGKALAARVVKPPFVRNGKSLLA
jgi:aminomethyltransferase